MPTRRLFQALAADLAATRPDQVTEPQAYLCWIETVQRVTTTLADANPRFSRTTFRAACGLDY